MSEHGSNETWYPIAITLLIAVISCLFYFLDELITIPWAAVRFIESYMWTHVLFFLPDIMTLPHAELREKLMTIDSWVDIGYKDAYQFEYSVLFRTTWIYLIPTIKFALLIVLKKRPLDEARTRLNVDELLKVQTETWRFNRYLLKYDPTKASLDVQSSVYAVREGILSGLKRTQIMTVDRDTNSICIDAERAHKVFSEQLRHRVDSPDDIYNMPFIIQFLFVVFSLREESLNDVYDATEKKKALRKIKALRLLRSINRTFPLPVLNKRIDKRLAGVEMEYAYADYDLTSLMPLELSYNENVRAQLLGDYSYYLNDEMSLKSIKQKVSSLLPMMLANSKIQSYFKEHAYMETLLRRLIFESRRFGKMPPSQFTFVKIIDRQLWYALSDEGLPGGAIEAIGVYSHYKLEEQTGIRQIFPHVDDVLQNVLPKLPKTADEFDIIKVAMTHPYSELYPYNPQVEFDAHKRRLEEDAEYRYNQALVNAPKGVVANG